MRDKISNCDFSYHGVALPLFGNFGMAGSEGGEKPELRTILELLALGKAQAPEMNAHTVGSCDAHDGADADKNNL